MSAPAHRKIKALRDRTERLLGRLYSHRETYNFIGDLKNLGEVALIGGAIRDSYLDGVNQFQSDFDFVIHPRVIDDFINLALRYNAKVNKFGGYGLQVNKWKIDIWPLQLTWAHRAGHKSVHSFNDLPGITFFNWDAVAYNLNTKRMSLKKSYFSDIEKRYLDINLLPNPNPMGNAIRALRYAIRWNATLSSRLTNHVFTLLKENGAVEFVKSEQSSFTVSVLTKDLLEDILQFLDLNGATSSSQFSISKQRQLSFHWDE